MCGDSSDKPLGRVDGLLWLVLVLGFKCFGELLGIWVAATGFWMWLFPLGSAIFCRTKQDFMGYFAD